MTVTNKKHLRPILSFDDALSLYAPTEPSLCGRAGVETEMHLYHAEEGEVRMPLSVDMEKIQRLLQREGFAPSLEASGVLEYASSPFLPSEMGEALQEIHRGLRRFEAVGEARGFTRAPFAVQPMATFLEARERMCDRERLKIGIASLLEVSPRGAGAVPLLTAGVQVSFSPCDQEAMFRMAYRAYALTPLLYAALNSDSGFVEKDSLRLAAHARGCYYEGYGKAAGVDESFLNAKKPSDYISNHIEQVMHTPMYFACLGDTCFPSTREKVLRFGALPREMKTQANFETAESFLYHDVKICNLRDEHGDTIGKRLEVRAADSGMMQPLMTPLLAVPLVSEGSTARDFERLLREFGFSGEPSRDALLFLEGRQNAVHHHGRFMQVAFGREGKGGLPAFAKEVSALLQDHYKGMRFSGEVAEASDRLHDILQTGRSDAVRSYEDFSSLDCVKAFMLRRAERSVRHTSSSRPTKGALDV